MIRSILTLFFMLAIFGMEAQACDCGAPGKPLAELDKSNSVFQGEVLTLDQEKSDSGHARNLVTFKVETSWKGLADHKKMTVRTATNGAACGFVFKKGEKYVVYANLTSKGELSASLCSRTAALKDADEDLRGLGKGTKPGN